MNRSVLACNGTVQTLQDMMTSRVRTNRADACDDVACDERRQKQADLSRLVLACTQLYWQRLPRVIRFPRSWELHRQQLKAANLLRAD